MDNFYLFILASILLAITPGPDNLYVLSNSIKYGKKHGILITTGLCIGLFVHMLMLLLGISFIIAANANVFFLLKLIGAGYLLYLARGFFINRHDKISIQSSKNDTNSVQLIKKGIFLNISNPKIIIFFLAFFPQFLTNGVNNNEQIIILAISFIVIAFTIFSSIAIAAGLLHKKISQLNNIMPILNIVIAVIFIFLAINLIVF